MDFLEKLPIVSGACFLIGLFLMVGGIRIIRDGKYLFVSRHTSADKWQYVLAVVDVAKRRLNIIWQGKHLKSFDYR